LKPHILDLLLTTFVTETSPNNIRYLLHLISCFVSEDVAFTPGLPALVIKTIQEKLFGGAGGLAITNDVIITGLETLSGLTGVYPFIRRDSKNCPRELVLSLCKYIDNLMEDNLVAYQHLITKAIECMVRWALSGEWITTDYLCLSSVVSTLCRGTGVLDRDDEFATVSGGFSPLSNSGIINGMGHKEGSPSLLGIGGNSAGGSGGGSGGGPGSGGNNSNVGISSSGSTAIFSTADKKKGKKDTKPLFRQHLRVPTPSNQSGSTPGVSTGTKDGGVGLPTFATLSAEILIKTAAEIGMSQLINHLGVFPPFGEVTGVARMSSIWSEEKEVRQWVTWRSRMKDTSIDSSSMDRRLDESNNNNNNNNNNNSNSNTNNINHANASILTTRTLDISEYKRYLKYYAYDKRVIIGIMERPNWKDDINEDDFKIAERLLPKTTTATTTTATVTPHGSTIIDHINVPGVIVVLRDASGKFTWMSSLKYMDHLKSGVTTPSTNPVIDGIQEGLERVISPEPDTQPLISSNHPSSSISPHSGNLNQFTSPPTSMPTSPSTHTTLPSNTATHFSPPPIPYLINGKVIYLESYNEGVIPKIEHILKEGTQEHRNFELIHAITERQCRMEQRRVNEMQDR